MEIQRLRSMFADTDYSGVSTHELAILISGCGLTGDELSRRANVSHRSITKVTTLEMPFTTLALADKILTALGMNISQMMVVIPTHHKAAASKMALDEMEVQCIPLDLEMIEQRADLFRQERLMILKFPTSHEKK